MNGICIPQKKYEKGAGHGAPTHQNLVPFVRQDGTFISVSAALAGDYTGLVARDLLVLGESGFTITLRFEVSGFPRPRRDNGLDSMVAQWPGYIPQDVQVG